jgi:SAM-dependent methyltransferase
MKTRLGKIPNLTVPESAEVFNTFAGFYNTYWSQPLTEELFPIVTALLLKQLPVTASILDVCCGNGHMVQWLRKQGYVADGLDASKGMLAYARQREAAATWFLADAKTFKVAQPYQAITCFTFGINHCCLTSADLLKTLKTFYKALHPKGLLLFDLVMEDKVQETSLKPVVIEQAGHALQAKGEYLPQDKKAYITIAMQGLETEKHAQSSEPAVRHIEFYQRCFSRETITHTLVKAGFNPLGFYDVHDDLGAAEATLPRLVVKAQKI